MSSFVTKQHLKDPDLARALSMFMHSQQPGDDMWPNFPQKVLQHYWDHIKTQSHPTILLSNLHRYPVNYLIQRTEEFFSAPTFHPYNKSSARAIGSVCSPCRSAGRALPHFSVLFPPHNTHLISLTESWHTTSLPTSKCSSNSWTKAWQSEDCLRS